MKKNKNKTNKIDKSPKKQNKIALQDYLKMLESSNLKVKIKVNKSIKDMIWE